METQIGKGHPDCLICGAIQEAIGNIKDDVTNNKHAQEEHREFVRMGTFKWVLRLLFIALIGLIAFQPVLLAKLSDIRTVQAVIEVRLDGLKEHVDEFWRSRNKERDSRLERNLERGEEGEKVTDRRGS